MSDYNPTLMKSRPHHLMVALSLWFLLLASPVVLAISEHTEILKRADWPQYVNGTNISALPQVRQILERFQEDQRITIEIRYPGGVLGRQWAESLANWLITFGVPVNYLELLLGSGARNQLVIALIDRR